MRGFFYAYIENAEYKMLKFKVYRVSGLFIDYIIIM